MAGAAQEQMLVPRFKNGRKTMVQYESVMPKGYHASAMVGGAVATVFKIANWPRRRWHARQRGSEAELHEVGHADFSVLQLG